jgi:hypothetical protein
MSLIAVRSTNRGVRWTADGRVVSSTPALSALIEQLGEPSALVCEPALFDGLRDVRRYLEQWLAEDGHILVPMSAGARAVLEHAGGLAIRGRGVVRLYALATLGADALDRRAAETADVWDVRDALEVALASDIFGDPIRSKARALEATGPFVSLDPAVRLALGDGDDFHRGALLAAYRAASVSTSRDGYERLLGLNAGAHGSLPRIVRGWYVERNTNTAFERESVMTWSDYRRALRTIFHRVKEAQSAAA